MLDLLKLGLILAFTILLILRRWDLGLVLLLDTILAAHLFAYPAGATLTSAWQGIIAPDTLNLVGAVFLMLTLAEVLRRTKSMEKMVRALQIVIPDSRIVLGVIPAVIGLMPMLGGAMFSAPMVNGIGSRLELSSERKTFVNYWFRHAMEYVWPLYTSVLMTAALLDISPFAFISASYPLSLTAIAGGVLWGLAEVPMRKATEVPRAAVAAWRELCVSVWPLLLVVLLVIVLRLHMLISLTSVILLFATVRRIGIDEWPDILRRSFPPRTFSAVLGVMVFKRVVEDAGAVGRVPAALGEIGLPPLLVAFLVPHLAGLLTGTPPAAIAISIPLVAPLMEAQAFDVSTGGVWMFAGAFSGIMVSPLHLCLALTREYFGANWAKLYRYIAPATALVVLVSLILVLVKSKA
jgi:integral membrane protein (TIGR00529 family)